MRLTVGPLPAAVYWRRRAVVLVGIAMIVLVVSYACGGPDPGAAGNGANAQGSPSQSPSPSTTLLRPEVPEPTATASPTPSAYTLPLPGATGPCTDAELDVSATAASPEVQRGQTLNVTIQIKNTSTRTCDRDIGADMQELRLIDPATKAIVWSSDDCGANHGSDVRSFDPAQVASFTITWQGRRSRGGDNKTVVCDNLAPEAQVYELVARLDQKTSVPFAVKITGGVAA
jgi:hypothetical protein